MTEIKRYALFKTSGGHIHVEDKTGPWCEWSDIEVLQAELNAVRAKALAAVWSLPEDTNHAHLHTLYEEARDVFMGRDKQTIAKLQDELANAREALMRAVRPPTPGVNTVMGFNRGSPLVGYVLQITGLRHANNGGLEIEVQLP